jgi:energy-coupling factor transport system substrate-specific component
MSWQAAVFAGLALVLAGGFAWYERTRPPARLVALVAALAGLAVAGRLVLAPIPNLVATTDVALLTGYALGGAPGFAVGALAAPISNIWLGQGPWTPWQMAGWGLVGIGGAALAMLAGRRLGRWRLALACALAALAYGALLDLSVMVTYGGEQSLDRYLALSARGVPFNVVHAVGSFAIALAAGPALVRMISRYRTRLEFSWRPTGALPLALVALVIGGSQAGSATDPPPAAGKPSSSSAAWLAGTQNRDGGFGATEDYPSSPAMTGWAMLGLEASGRNPLDVRSAGRTPVAYLRAQVERLRSVGDLERTILALEAAGLDARDFAGQDMVAELRARRRGDGSVGGQVNLTAFYALALRAAGAEPANLGRPLRWLRRAQNRDGGWGIQPGAPSDAESTGAALQAIAAGGGTGRASGSGVRFLDRAQRAEGGFTVGTTGVVNSQATAWAVQGMLAVGAGGKPLARALSYLEGLRAPDGHYRYSRSSDQTPVWVTAQALLAVAREPFPLAPVARRPPPAKASREGASPTPAAAPMGGAGASAPDASVAGAPSGGGETGTGAGRAGGHAADAARGDENPRGSSRASARSGASSTTAAAAADAGAGEPGREEEEVTAEPAATTAGDRSSTAPWVWGGLGALALLLASGFLWYRRRLP